MVHAWIINLCSCGGNLLVNIGITADGRIIPIFEERLRQMGEYLQRLPNLCLYCSL